MSASPSPHRATGSGTSRLGRWLLLASLLVGALAPSRTVDAAAVSAMLVEPQFETLSDEHQRQFGTILALAQDRAGVLWIGSLYGLLSYDGYRAQRYSRAPGDANALPSDYIRSLMADSAGLIWVGTDADGLAIYDPVKQLFQTYRHRPDHADSLSSNSVWAMAEDARRGVWIGTNDGLNLMQGESRRITRYRAGEPGGPGDGRIRRMLVDQRGSLWIGTESSLERLPAGGDRFEAVAGELLNGASIASLFEAADGTVWVAAGGSGVFRLPPDGGDALRLPGDALRAVGERPVVAIAQPTTEQIWLRIENGGIVVVAADDGRLLSEIVPDPSVPGSLLTAGTKYEAMLTDRSGLLWISATGAGLQKYNPHNAAFTILRHRSDRPETIGTNAINTLMESADGLLWIGTDGQGIDVLDRQRGVIDRWPAHAGPGPGLHDGVIRALAESADGRIWIGTQRAGLYRLDRPSRTLARYTAADGLPDNVVRDILPDAQGSLWLGTNRGVAHFDPATARFTPLSLTTGQPMQERVRTLLLDRQQRLWVATANGLFLRSPDVQGLRRVGEGEGEPALSQHGILGLHLDAADRLWVSTSNGLDRLRGWQGEQPLFESISRRLGVLGEALGENVLSDDQGRLWTGSELIDPSTWSLTRIGRADGADIGTIWGGAYTQSRDGVMWFASRKGILAIDPGRKRAWTFQPPVVATALKLDGTTVPLGHLTPSLQIEPEIRSFSIEFAALDYSSPASNRYGYQLEGYDRDWIETDAGNRNATYSNLWPGSYTLRIRGSNRVGAWSTQELRIPVRVLPAFWQTPWFAAMLVLTVGGAVLGAVRWRTARMRQQAETLQSLVTQRTAQWRTAHDHLLETQQQLITQEKMAALGTLTAGVAHEINNPTNFIGGAAQNLAVQMHEFREFLRKLAGGDADPEVLAAIDAALQPQYEQLETILDGSLRISAIVRDLRQFTRLDEAERKSIAIGEPIQSTVNLVRTRFDRIAFELDLGVNPEIECQPAKLGQVFMNLIVNACEATLDSDRAGWVRIATAETDREVVVHVQDNGPGMDEATRQRVFEPFFTTKAIGKGTGLGLAVSLGIVREHGGDIEVDSVPGSGCCFRVRLPLASTRH